MHNPALNRESPRAVQEGQFDPETAQQSCIRFALPVVLQRTTPTRGGWLARLPSPAMTRIHPTAIISPEVSIRDDVEIGPYCLIQGPVTLNEGARLLSHVVIHGPAEIGRRNCLYPGVTIGLGPQDVKFKPGDVTAGVVIGDDGLFREHVTIHAATKPDVPTRIGHKAFFMVGSHVGHDAVVGNSVTLVNGASLAGHTSLADNVTISAYGLIHQFCRVGRFAFFSGSAGVTQDVPSFCIVVDRGLLAGVNVVGLRRAGVPRADITAIRRAYREAFRPGLTREDVLRILDDLSASSPLVVELAEFIRGTKRGYCHRRLEQRADGPHAEHADAI